MLSSKPRIICVDDDEDSCELISMMLHLANDDYQVSTVSTAQELLDLTVSQSVDLYVLDYALPDMTGAELCREIRRSDRDTPILFYSAMAREIDRQRAMAAGANEYLIKPNDLDRLTETIQRLLAESPTISKSDFSVESKTYDRIY